MDPSDNSKVYHDFRDSKIGKNWLECREIVTNGGMRGGGSKNCHFCGDVLFERPLAGISFCKVSGFCYKQNRKLL